MFQGMDLYSADYCKLYCVDILRSWCTQGGSWCKDLQSSLADMCTDRRYTVHWNRMVMDCTDQSHLVLEL